MADREFTEPFWLDSYSSPLNNKAKTPLENINSALPGNWIFTINHFPNAEHFISSSGIPGLSLGEAIQPTPFVDIPHSAEKLQFEPMVVEFNIDERWENYIEMQRWIRGHAFPEAHAEHAAFSKFGNSLDDHGYADASHVLFTNDGQPLYRVEYKKMFPISLETIQLVAGQSPTPLVAAVTLRYAYYVIKRLPDGLMDQ